jgi:hypothetical protein
MIPAFIHKWPGNAMREGQHLAFVTKAALSEGSGFGFFFGAAMRQEAGANRDEPPLPFQK